MLRRSARPVASGNGCHMLGDGHRFTGERRLGGGQRSRVDQPGVRAHRVAGRQQQDVAGHEVARSDGLFRAFAQNPHLQRRKSAQRSHRLFGTPFLVSADEGVRHHHAQDDGSVAPVAHGAGQCRSDKQDVDQRALELAQQEQEDRALGGFRQGVRAVLGNALRDSL